MKGSLWLLCWTKGKAGRLVSKCAAEQVEDDRTWDKDIAMRHREDWESEYIFFKLTDFRKRETSICYSTYLYIHWLILVCALTWNQTRNLVISGQRSNQLSYLSCAGI